MNDGLAAEAREAGYVSIGRLAEECGISPDRLRIWERRYGKPQPARLASGHRRYPPEEITRMRRVAELLARGLRPGKLLGLADRELAALHLEQTTVGPSFDDLELWVGWVREFRRAELADALVEAARGLPLVEYLGQRAAPLLAEIGTRWADGRLSVRHEHFATRVVADHLAGLRAGFGEPSSLAPFVLASLTGERHGMALEILSVIAAREGAECIALGIDTPLNEIAGAALESGATAVAISVSLSQGVPAVLRNLRVLREALGQELELVVGGTGMLGRGPHGVQVLANLEGFEDWLRHRRAVGSSGEPHP